MNFNEYKDVFFASKKYWMAYLVMIILLGISTCRYKTLLDPRFELATLAIVAIVGIFCIVYYFMHNTDKEMYKVAFVVILCFGIITSFIVPICDVSDETEHLARAEITSQGVFIPHWTGEDLGVDRAYNASGPHKANPYNKGAGYSSIVAVNFFTDFLGKTVYQTSFDTQKIDYTPTIIVSAFEQNPFYGYIPQAIGMLVAKLLDLNVIWLMWLGRIFNLICYAGLISLAVKKTPVLKIPILAVACIPLAMYQAASLSIDSMIIGLAILTIAYFIRLYKAEIASLGVRHVVIFSGICLLLGLCKLPYLAFILMLFMIPFENFKKGKKIIPYMIICLIIVGIIGVMWSKYSTPTLMHSWRSRLKFINSTAQMNYVTSHPIFIGRFIQQMLTYNLSHIVYGTFNFFGAAQKTHYIDSYHAVVACLLIFLAATLLAYPRNVRFRLRTKLGALFILLLIYFSTGFIQLLTWASVGYLNLGITTRYFVPLFALLPIIINLKSKKLKKLPLGKLKKPIDKYKSIPFDNFAMVCIIGFMAVMILSFATKYY